MIITNYISNKYKNNYTKIYNFIRKMDNNVFELLNIILMIQKMIFFLFVMFASMCGIAYVSRVMLVREMRR